MASEQLVQRPADAPALGRIERVSPTLGAALDRCFLQVAFAQDKRFNFLRKPTTAAALGVVAHKLAEFVAQGRFRDADPQRREKLFERDWDEQLAVERAKLEEAWPLGAVPPPQRWRGYELVRTRLRALLVEHAERQEQKPVTEGGREVEAWLRDPSGRLFGRPDRVEVSPDGSVEIVDIKSGWALPDEMKPEHRRQLLAYAFLWHAEHGVWPKRATIQRLDGSCLSIEVDPAHAQAVARELDDAVDAYNDAVEKGVTAEELASPKPDTCELCGFRAACGPFFSTLREEWGWYRRFALGRVTDVIPAGPSSVVELATASTNLSGEPESVRVLGVPNGSVPASGTRIAIANAIPARGPGGMRLAWDSEILVW